MAQETIDVFDAIFVAATLGLKGIDMNVDEIFLPDVPWVKGLYDVGQAVYNGLSEAVKARVRPL